MTPFQTNLVMLGINSLLGALTFLFGSWIRGQMKELKLEMEAERGKQREALLAMELRFTLAYVAKVDFDQHSTKVERALETMTTQLIALQRMVDRRWGSGEPTKG